MLKGSGGSSDDGSISSAHGSLGGCLEGNPKKNTLALDLLSEDSMHREVSRLERNCNELSREKEVSVIVQTHCIHFYPPPVSSFGVVC